MSRPLFTRLAAGLSALLLSAALCTATPADDARRDLETGIGEVFAALRARPEGQKLADTLDPVVAGHFAFETTTRLAVGPAWRDFDPAHRARATELFGRLVVRTYSDRLRGDTPPRVVFEAPVELKPGRVEVPTKATTADGQTYSVAYRLEAPSAPPPARWRVYDVVAEGVSLIGNYRAQFEPIVSRGGADALLAALETKVAEAAASAVP